MNETNANENVYAAAIGAERAAGAALKSTQNRIHSTQGKYINAVIVCALESEKARRKRDKLVNLTVIGLILLASLIALIFSPIIAGSIFAALMAVYIIVMSNGRYKRLKSYRERKAFFTKYEKVIPGHMALKWKPGNTGTASNSAASEFDKNDDDGSGYKDSGNASWYCPDCGGKNTGDARFCEFCGCSHEKY